MNRREFGKRSLLGMLWLALATTGTAIMEGCNWVSDLKAWIPVGVQALTSLLTLLSGAGVILPPGIAAVIALIQAGFTDLEDAIANYQSTNPPPVGTLAKIDTFLSDLAANWQSLLSGLPAMSSNILTLVIGIAELALSTIMGFVASAQAATPAAFPKTNATLLKPTIVQGRTLSVSPQKMSVHAFISRWNNLLTAGGHKEAKIHMTFHEHFEIFS